VNYQRPCTGFTTFATLAWLVRKTGGLSEGMVVSEWKHGMALPSQKVTSPPGQKLAKNDL
jgi:hypothetical protein